MCFIDAKKLKGSSRVACGILCKVTTPAGERAEYNYLGDVKLSQPSSTGMESGDSHRASKSVAHPPTLDHAQNYETHSGITVKAGTFRSMSSNCSFFQLSRLLFF